MNRNSVIESLDWVSILIYAVLVGLGWLNIYSVTSPEEGGAFADFSYKYFKQLVWIGFAIVLLVSVLIIDSKFFEAFAYVFFGVSMLSLLLVLGVGSEVNGAKSWIQFGSFSIQPAEFAKFSTALALAKLLTSHNFSLSNYKNMIMAFGLFFIPVVFILLQNDTGSALVYLIFSLPLFREGLSGNYLIAALLAALYFIFSIIYSETVVYVSIVVLVILYHAIKRQYLHLIVSVGGLALTSGVWYLINRLELFELSFELALQFYAVLLTAYYITLTFVKRYFRLLYIPLFIIISFFYTASTNYIFENVLGAHQQSRILVVLGQKEDPLGVEYNVIQSKIAIGSGGFSGKGFGQGTQTSGDFIPEQSTDFIFSSIGEEWGFIGSATVILLFVFLMLRLIHLAERQRSRFSRIYGYCVASIFFFHFAVNIGMAIGILPVIGIPLPFFSYGGSSLWSFTILLFIFLRLDASRKEILR